MKRLLRPFYITLCLLISLPAYSQVFDQFIEGLQSDLLFKNTEVSKELSEEISVRPLGAISRFMNPDGTAVYTPWRNLIQLDQDLLKRTGRSTFGRSEYAIKDAREIRGENYRYVSLATIFHEMGHAELDAIIEKEENFAQQGVMHAYRYLLKPFYKETFSAFRTYPIFHEHFAYYRTEMIEFFYGELGEIFLSNGFNQFTQTCFLPAQVENLLKSGINKDDFLKFHVFGADEFYRKQISPRFVFVRGRHYDLHEGDNYQEVLDQAYLFFWSYHQQTYEFPIDRKDFVEKINQSDNFRQFRECRKKLYREFHQ